jgi:aryl-alcohol dehydrogenase-like predicted oxidoreductase
MSEGGLMGAYGPLDRNEALQVLDLALNCGCTFWDTAVFYSNYFFLNPNYFFLNPNNYFLESYLFFLNPNIFS